MNQSNEVQGADDEHIANLKSDELSKLDCPSSITEFQRMKLDKDAKKNWDLFYKRNGDRFFRNRYWTKHEFAELFHPSQTTDRPIYLLEVGCGCGDFVLPLLESAEKSDATDVRVPENLYIYCCDISEQAINLLKTNPMYQRHHPTKISAFTADISKRTDLELHCDNNHADIVSLVFVLSSLDPRSIDTAISNIYRVLKPSGLVLFRDYAIYDKAMLRFNEKSKICDKFYVRQDGTRVYFFSKSELIDLFQRYNFVVESIEHVHRETINNSSGDKFSRIFLQAKFRKTSDERRYS